MTIRIGSLLLAEFMNRDICLKIENHESIVANVDWLNACIFVTAALICNKCNADRADKQESAEEI